MARDGPAPGKATSAWAAALAVLIALAAAVEWVAPDLSSIASFRVPAGQLHVIPASWERMPRRPLDGEALVAADRAPRHVAFQLFHSFERAERARQRHALLMPAVSGTTDLFVNGAPIFEAPLRSARLQGQAGYRSELLTIEPEYYHLGTNRIDLAIADAPARPIAASLYHGPEAELRPVLERAAEWSRTARQVLPALGLLAALLAIAASTSPILRATYLPLAAASAAIGARAFIARAPHADLLGASWLATDRLLLLATLLCFALLRPNAEWARWGRSVRRVAAGAAAAACLLVVAGLAVSGAMPDVSAATAKPAVVLAAVPAVLALAGHFRAIDGLGPARTAMLAGLGAVAAVALVAAIVGSLEMFLDAQFFRIELAYGLSVIAGLAAIAIAAAFQIGRRTVRFARERIELARLISLQREEIDTKTRALEQETRRAAVLEERQRLARDMHDGIGGQLISLIARVRSGQVEIDQVEQELADGLSELRLVVDSLDAADDSLASALAVFRARARAQVEAHGTSFAWEEGEGIEMNATDPRWTLNIYRVLQEAVSNAVRHAKGTTVKVIVSRDDDDLVFAVTDDGIGIPEEGVRGSVGHGLVNMAHRARQLGGTLELERGAGGSGTIVRMRVPVPAAAGQSRGEISPS